MRLNKYGLLYGVGCWVVLLGGVLLARPAQAQPGIATLKQQLTVAKADTSRSRLLCELGQQYLDTNLDSSFYFFNSALQTARRSKDSVGMARAMYQLGYIHIYYTKDEGKATNWINQALAMARPANNYDCLANCYRLLAIMSIHQHIGNAEELLKKALAYAQKSRNHKTIADTYGTYCNVIYLIDPDNFKRQQYLLKQAMAASQQSDPDFFFTMGLDYCELLNKNGKHREALAMARRLEAQTNRLQKRQGEFVYSCDMGRLFGLLKKYGQAEAAMVAGIGAEKHRPKPDSVHLYHYFRYLLNIYLADEAWQKAYATRDSLATIQLWLQSKRQTRDAKLQMTQQQAAFDIEERDNQIKLLDVQKKQQQFVLIGVVLVALLLIGFVWVLYRTRQRIERQRTQLTQLNATKDKLFAIISHDLRSPVAGLKNYLMLIDWGALTKEAFAESTRHLTSRLNAVQTMLENVLNWSLSQMEGMQPRLETVALAPIVKEELTLLHPIALAKSIQLTDHIPPEAHLLADPNHIAIIIRNLVQNALKFTPTGGAVDIGYFQSQEGHTIEIRDTGVGIDKGIQVELFQLNKGPSRAGTANEPGTGLGLVLVKELIEANEGHIEVVSEPGKGTIFTLTFAQEVGKFNKTRKPTLSTSDA